MKSICNEIQKCKKDNSCHMCPTETLQKLPSEKCQIDHDNNIEENQCQTCKNDYFW